MMCKIIKLLSMNELSLATTGLTVSLNLFIRPTG